MDDTSHDRQRNRDRTTPDFETVRRAVLKAAGASAALPFAGAAAGRPGGAADAARDHHGGDGSPADIDPIFGRVSAEPSPCHGDAPADCVEEFPEPIRPDHEVEMRIGIPGLLFALGASGVLSEETTAALNEAVADGEIDPETDPDRALFENTVTVAGRDLTGTDIAGMLVDTLGFYFGPTAVHVRPGDVVLFGAETPDHSVAAYHERHGRQNRVPDGVGPISSPLVPVQGYWLYRFGTEGVYDLYCPPHQVFGMVARIVVHDGDGPVPGPGVEDTGRPPADENFLPHVLGGLDPNLPSSHEALANDVLDPEHVVDRGSVSRETLVAAHREGGE